MPKLNRLSGKETIRLRGILKQAGINLEEFIETK